MSSLRFSRAADGALTVEPLPLRMPHARGVIDPEPYRVRARGDGPALIEHFDPSDGVRTLYLPDGREMPLFGIPGPLLTFVVSGGLEFRVAGGEVIRLQPGDMFLVAENAADGDITISADCRLIQLRVPDGWPGEKVREVAPAEGNQRGDAPCNIKRMVTIDRRSYFQPFEGLFAHPGRWSAFRPLIGFRFIGMHADTFIDWHPEIVNNFVIVMGGALELEVGGTPGAVEIFRQGDVCLAQDRTGQGHIDRVHGYVQVAVLIMEDEALWPLDG